MASPPVEISSAVLPLTNDANHSVITPTAAASASSSNSGGANSVGFATANSIDPGSSESDTSNPRYTYLVNQQASLIAEMMAVMEEASNAFEEIGHDNGRIAASTSTINSTTRRIDSVVAQRDPINNELATLLPETNPADAERKADLEDQLIDLQVKEDYLKGLKMQAQSDLAAAQIALVGHQATWDALNEEYADLNDQLTAVTDELQITSPSLPNN